MSYGTLKESLLNEELKLSAVTTALGVSVASIDVAILCAWLAEQVRTICCA
jgi:hypothetical protein